MNQSTTRRWTYTHRWQRFTIGTNVADNGQETIVQGGQFVKPIHNKLVQHNDQQISMVSTKQGEVDRKSQLVRLVQWYSEASFAGEFQQNKRADVQQAQLASNSKRWFERDRSPNFAYLGRFFSAFKHQVENRNQQLVHITAPHNVREESGAFFEELPQQDQQFLLVVNLNPTVISTCGKNDAPQSHHLNDWARQVSIDALMNVVEQPCKSAEHKIEFFRFFDVHEHLSKNVKTFCRRVIGVHVLQRELLSVSFRHQMRRKYRMTVIQQHEQCLHTVIVGAS